MTKPMNNQSELDRSTAHSHPGDLLKRRYLEPLNIKAQGLATAMGISKSQVSRILSGRCSITADVALRLEHCLGASAEMWMKLQMAHDLEITKRSFDSAGLERLHQSDHSKDA